jgi:periplasmic protein CpxP/Spy
MKISTRIITAVLLIAGSSGVVYAFGKHGDWGMTPAEKVEFISERVTDKLDLDETQAAYFKHLAGTVSGIMQALRPTHQQRSDEFMQLLQEPGFDQARALQLVQQRTRLIDEKAPEVIAELAIFMDSLTPQQRQQVQQFIEHRHDRHMHGG